MNKKLALLVSLFSVSTHAGMPASDGPVVTRLKKSCGEINVVSGRPAWDRSSLSYGNVAYRLDRALDSLAAKKEPLLCSYLGELSGSVISLNSDVRRNFGNDSEADKSTLNVLLYVYHITSYCGRFGYAAGNLPPLVKEGNAEQLGIRLNEAADHLLNSATQACKS